MVSLSVWGRHNQTNTFYLSFDPKLFHKVIEIRSTDPQGGGRLYEIEIILFKDPKDELPVHFLTSFLQCHSARFRTDLQFQVFIGKLSPPDHDDGPSNPILQFPHISWPGVVIQRVEPPLGDPQYLRFIFFG